jgi:Flp pilus assembly pilin Flp
VDFLKDEKGQDLVEYSLLLAFITLACVALFLTSTGSIMGIWTAANNVLGAGNSLAKSGSS